MPVILDPTRFGPWLDPASEPALLKAMMSPAPARTLDRMAVSTRVNSPRFDDPQCLLPEPESPPEPEPVAEAVQGDLFRADGDSPK